MLIHASWKDELYKYMAGIIRGREQKLMIINGMPDHIHILLGLKPDCSLSDLVREIKSNSSKWINENFMSREKFQWQTGFGAFSVGQREIKIVIDYIFSQEIHHGNKKFRAEYAELLKDNQIEFENQYLFIELDAAPTEPAE